MRWPKNSGQRSKRYRQEIKEMIEGKISQADPFTLPGFRDDFTAIRDACPIALRQNRPRNNCVIFSIFG
jgi:hypothetical protein